MAKFDFAQEDRLHDAVAFYHNNPHVKQSVIARKFIVKYKSLRDRINGVNPGALRGGHNTRLSRLEDEGLKKYMGFLARIGMPPSKSDIRHAADLILARKGEPPVLTEWACRWLKRNNDFYKTTRAKDSCRRTKGSAYS